MSLLKSAAMDGRLLIFALIDGHKPLSLKSAARMAAF
jgi:hypothetical protein